MNPRIAKEILTYVNTSKNLIMTVPFIEGKRVLYINERFTFNALKEALQIETQKPVELTPPAKLDMDDSLVDYLLDKDQPINIKIAEDQFVLTPAYAQIESQLLKKAQPLVHTPTHIYQKNIDDGMDPSHSNTLSWLVTCLNQQISEKQGTFNFKDIKQVYHNSLSLHKSPVREKILLLQHKQNINDAEIEDLEQRRSKMEYEAKQKGVLFLFGLLGASILQIGGFYYGIYMVEDWGWDVMEPFSYSFQCLGVLLGIRFYQKYRKQRGLETILDAFFLNRMKTSRAWREQWNHLNQVLDLKKQQKQMLAQQMLVWRNRINYHNYSSK